MCWPSRRGKPLTLGTRWTPRFDFVSKNAIRDADGYMDEVAEGVKRRIYGKIAGRKVAANVWKGTFSTWVRVYRDGRLTNRCKSGEVTWRVSQPIGSATFESQPGDRVGDGRVFDFRLPGDRIKVEGDRQRITGVAGAFRFTFAARRGGALRPGIYDNAVAYPGNGTRHGLTVTRNNNSCDALDGRFEILDIKFVRERLRFVHLRFDQHCTGDSGLLEGEIRFRGD